MIDLVIVCYLLDDTVHMKDILSDFPLSSPVAVKHRFISSSRAASEQPRLWRRALQSGC